MRSFRIDEVSAVDHPAQVGARALLVKRAPLPDATIDRDHREHRDRAAVRAEQLACDDSVAAAVLGIELSPDLAAAPEVDEIPPGPDASPEEWAAYGEAVARYRDRVERETRLNPRPPRPRMTTLLDVDHALESRAVELRRENESMQQSFARLARGGDEAFDALLAERDRVEREGP